MCGLFGVAGRGISHVDIKAFRQLGIVTQLRGLDGAGVYIDKVLKPKNAIFPREFKSEFDFSSLLSDDPDIKSVLADVMIGHCRAATVGEVQIENCHPFKHGNLVMTHNGTLTAQIFNQDKTKTDSEQMVMHMAEHGVMDALEELSDFDAYAIAGVDTETGDMYMGRNSERPFYVAISKVRSVMWWSSEKLILDMVLDRVKAGDRKTYVMSPGKLYKFNVKDINSTDHSIFRIADIKPKNPWGYGSNGKKTTGTNVIPITGRAGTGGSQSKKESTSEDKDKEESTKVVNYVDCCDCGKGLTPKDYREGRWMGVQKGYQCKGCYEDDIVKRQSKFSNGSNVSAH